VLKWLANGRTYYTESEDVTFGQRAYGLLGGRLGFAAGHWRVAAYTENLLNQQYYSSISAGTMHGTPGAPRTQGIEACLAF
jgi:outer membrane receptor protein involved in Fe transport